MKIVQEVSPEFEGIRLDQFLSERMGDGFSRSQVQKWIEMGNVRLSSSHELAPNQDLPPSRKSLKPSQKLKGNETIEVEIPKKRETNLEPVNLNLKVLFEEEDYLVIEKPDAIATHGGPGDSSTTLVNGLLYHFQSLSQVGGFERPGIVHRLDKPTAGLLVVAKTDRGHLAFSKLFQTREIEKEYVAWVWNSVFPPEGTIDAPIGRHPKERLKMCTRPDGRPAITHYQTMKVMTTMQGRKFSFLKIRLETGRTHQIRVHLQKQSASIVGDLLYSKASSDYAKYGLLLFSKRLKFRDPFSNKIQEIELDLPERFLKFEKSLGQT